MRSPLLCALAALLGVAAPAPGAQRGSDPQAELDRLLAGRVAGEPVSCLSLRRVGRAQIVSGEAIVYSASNRQLFVNRPNGGAKWLIRDAVLVANPRVGQLCRGDPVYIIVPHSNIERGFITLGDFVPYTGPRAGR